MRDRIDPRSLDITALCRDGGALDGQLGLAELTRLGGSLFGAPESGAEVAWRAQAGHRLVAGGDPERWLQLTARAEVTLQCQRCLQATRQPLAVERRFRFVRSEQEAARLDEEIEDDVLVLSPRLDLLELLEDELILALPIVARHGGACPQPLPMPAAPADEPPPNPFAKLAALRGRAAGGDPEQN
jgi:uncharacterized protein